MRPSAKALLLAALAAAGTSAAADFDGDSREDIAVYRPSSGKWLIRGITQVFFGTAADTPVAGDFSGDGIAEVGIFRPSSGLWRIRNTTRGYFGTSTDIPITGGGSGQRLYDYVVKAGNGADLLAALQSTTYTSVFVPAGTYYVYSMINVASVKRISGESLHAYPRIMLINGQYLNITSQGCLVEDIIIQGGGDSILKRGSFYVNNAWYVTLRNCYSLSSAGNGFEYTSASQYVTFLGCNAEQSDDAGFQGSNTIQTARIIGCAAEDCYRGFSNCNNLSACVSEDASAYGFDNCYNLSSCAVKGPVSGGVGFHGCDNLSACRAEGVGDTAFFGCDQVGSCSVVTAGTGFDYCGYLSSCVAYGCSTSFTGCFSIDSDSCNN